MLKFWSVINSIFVHWTKKLTLVFLVLHNKSKVLLPLVCQLLFTFFWIIRSQNRASKVLNIIIQFVIIKSKEQFTKEQVTKELDLTYVEFDMFRDVWIKKCRKCCIRLSVFSRAGSIRMWALIQSIQLVSTLYRYGSMIIRDLRVQLKEY